MKEIQLRREKEELSRQARLQEKREQAEIAKQERQRYELHRKENLPRSNVVDGISSGYRGLTRTEMNQHASSSVTNGGTPFRMNGPLSTPPSAFSGFTGLRNAFQLLYTPVELYINVHPLVFFKTQCTQSFYPAR